MLLAAKALLDQNPTPTVEEVKEAISGNLCRCTGYVKIIDSIMAASGTVTLQAAIHGTPQVIVYKVSPVSAWLAKILVRVPNVGLVNLVAGRELVPELLQDDATGDNIASAIQHMLKGED